MGAPRITKSFWEIISSLAVVVPGPNDRILVAPQPGTPFLSQCKATTVADIAAGLDIQSGTYLPVASNLINMDAVVPHTYSYIRVGAVVSVSGIVEVDPTAAGGAGFDLTIPVPSTFATAFDAAGCIGSPNSGVAISEVGAVVANAGTARVSIQMLGENTSNHGIVTQFMYQVI